MLLKDKVALLYGGGGAIGSAVAHAFAREGASVYLAGRTQEKLDKVAAEIQADGGMVETAVLDALNEEAVNSFVDDVATQTGHIDISFNVIGYQDVHKLLSEITVEEFLQPIVTAARTQFLTTRAAARHMTVRGSGVILHFGGGGPQTTPGLGGFKVALDAVESLRRQWALELGPYGIRVITLKTGGIPETIPDDFQGKEQIINNLLPLTQLKRMATLADVGHVAAFAASDYAQSITATDINISCGAIVD